MEDLPTPSLLLSRLRIKHLRLVDALARTQSLRRTAAILAVSQPAATKILQDLEAVLGMKLFSRNAQAVRINPMGEFVARYARRMLQETVRFGEDLKVLEQGGAGTLTVGAIMAAHTWLVPAAIAALKERRPLLTIRLMESSSDKLLADLEKNEFDLVVGRFSRDAHQVEFDFVPLKEEDLCVFVRAGHPCAGISSLAGLADQPWLLQPEPTPTRMLLARVFAEDGLPLPANVVETASVYATLNLVKHAGMIAVLPRPVVEAEGALLRILPIRLGHTLSPFGIVTRKGFEPSSGTDELKALLVELSNSPV